MSKPVCPGQDTRLWTADAVSQVPCHNCGNMIEFWKDEGRRRCKQCGARVRNPNIESGCAKWCSYAEECLGYVPMDADSDESVCAQLIEAMKEVFGTNHTRVSHSLKVLEFAEDILADEQATPLVVVAAAVLHDIGILEAERKHGSSAACFQELEGPPIARKIMENVGLDDPTIDHVCKIVGNHHSARDIDTPEFRIVWDADWLVNIPAEFAHLDRDGLKAAVDGLLKTAAGRRKAAELYEV